MEWGIKLKNNHMEVVVKNTFFAFIAKCIIGLVLMGIVLTVMAEVISNSDFQWLYDTSPHFYLFLVNLYRLIFDRGYFLFIAFFLSVTMVLIFLYQLLKKIYSYAFSISASADQLFDPNIEYINLPPEMVEVEKKLNHFKRQAIQNEKLARENEEKKDELIVYLAHDIKTPLTSMIGYLSLLSEVKDMPEEQRERYIDIALDKSYRLEELINELFEVARFNSEKIILEKEELNLNLMFAQMIDDFYPILKEMDKEITFYADEEIILYADSDKLSRVFNNLIKNAIYYSKEKTSIKVTAREEGKKVIVQVTNQGKQIPKEKLDRIFENFYRLDSSRTSKTGGSGLGLAIAKEIVELHQGKISAFSKEDETTFTVVLPKK